jgi:transcriptional activator HAC1
MTYIKLETLAEASTPYGAPDSPASPTATDSTRTSPERSSESVDPETHEADDDNDKRPTKKRKSWGQVLPEPKTCLPPRKRAKTEDEKEQRRVERVLRNRRAAQSSRERKRQEVEALEKRNKELEHRLEVMQRDRVTLLAQLKQHMCRGSGLATRPSSSHDSPMLFTGIFDDEAGTSADSDALMTDLQLAAPDSPTVDPKSLSPELPPARLVAPTEAPAKFPKSILKTTASSAAPTTLPASVLPAAPVLAAPSKPVSSDQTQRPAVSVRGDRLGGVDVMEPFDFHGLVPFPLDAGAAAPGGHDSVCGVWDAFDFTTSFDHDLDVLERGIPHTPDSSHFDDGHVAADAPLDYGEFLHGWLAGAPTADAVAPALGYPDLVDQLFPSPFSGAPYDSAEDACVLLDHPEDLAPSEAPYQQPHSGATSRGCDDGGIAVGGF